MRIVIQQSSQNSPIPGVSVPLLSQYGNTEVSAIVYCERLSIQLFGKKIGKWINSYGITDYETHPGGR